MGVLDASCSRPCHYHPFAPGDGWDLAVRARSHPPNSTGTRHTPLPRSWRPDSRSDEEDDEPMMDAGRAHVPTAWLRHWGTAVTSTSHYRARKLLVAASESIKKTAAAACEAFSTSATPTERSATPGAQPRAASTTSPPHRWAPPPSHNSPRTSRTPPAHRDQPLGPTISPGESRSRTDTKPESPTPPPRPPNNLMKRVKRAAFGLTNFDTLTPPRNTESRQSRGQIKFPRPQSHGSSSLCVAYTVCRCLSWRRRVYVPTELRFQAAPEQAVRARPCLFASTNADSCFYRVHRR